MLVKKRISSFRRLYSNYEEMPEDFLDEIDSDSFFHRNIFDVSQSQHRIVRVSISSNKILRTEVVRILQFKETAGLYPPRRNEHFEKKLSLLVDSFHDFLETFDKASKCLQIPSSDPKIELGSTKLIDDVFAHYYIDTIERPKTQIRLRFQFGENNCCIFSPKKLELNGN